MSSGLGLAGRAGEEPRGKEEGTAGSEKPRCWPLRSPGLAAGRGAPGGGLRAAARIEEGGERGSSGTGLGERPRQPFCSLGVESFSRGSSVAGGPVLPGSQVFGAGVGQRPESPEPQRHRVATRRSLWGSSGPQVSRALPTCAGGFQLAIF